MTENEEKNIPVHVVIIPDANRRWAGERGLQPWEGHEAGAKNIEKLIRFALKKGIRCISFWGSSIDNLTKRPLEEKRALLDIYKRYFGRLLEDKEIEDEEVKINVIGRWEEQFPESLQRVIRKLTAKTDNFKKRMINFMLAYSGTDDMKNAIEMILNQYEKGTKVSERMIKENLMTASLPPVDYLIRTGGEPHLSGGFMMWDTADSQLFFSEKKFPDFDESSFEEALEEYARRKRRFGS